MKHDGLTEKDRKFAMVLALNLSEKFGLKTGAILASAATMAMVINEFGETIRFMKSRKKGGECVHGIMESDPRRLIHGKCVSKKRFIGG